MPEQDPSISPDETVAEIEQDIKEFDPKQLYHGGDKIILDGEEWQFDNEQDDWWNLKIMGKLREGARYFSYAKSQDVAQTQAKFRRFLEDYQLPTEPNLDGIDDEAARIKREINFWEELEQQIRNSAVSFAGQSNYLGREIAGLSDTPWYLKRPYETSRSFSPAQIEKRKKLIQERGIAEQQFKTLFYDFIGGSEGFSSGRGPHPALFPNLRGLESKYNNLIEENFQKLSPEEQQQIRQDIYEMEAEEAKRKYEQELEKAKAKLGQESE